MDLFYNKLIPCQQIVIKHISNRIEWKFPTQNLLNNCGVKKSGRGERGKEKERVEKTREKGKGENKKGLRGKIKRRRKRRKRKFKKHCIDKELKFQLEVLGVRKNNNNTRTKYITAQILDDKQDKSQK